MTTVSVPDRPCKPAASYHLVANELTFHLGEQWWMVPPAAHGVELVVTGDDGVPTRWLLDRVLCSRIAMSLQLIPGVRHVGLHRIDTGSA